MQRIPGWHLQVDGPGLDLRLHLGEIDAIDVYHAVGCAEIGTTHLPAEMIATPEGDVQTELLVEQ